MALLLTVGLSLVPEDLQTAAKVDSRHSITGDHGGRSPSRTRKDEHVKCILLITLGAVAGMGAARTVP